MLRMAKRKPGNQNDPPRKPPNRTGEPLNVWLRSELMAVLRDVLANTTPRTSKTALVELALEDLFRKLGYLPRPSEPKEE